MTEKRFSIEFDGHQYFLVTDEVNERCLARLDTRFDALAWLEIYKMLSEENEELKSDLDYFQRTYEIEERGLDVVAPMCTIGSPTPSRLALFKENEQLKQRIKSRLHYYRELCNKFDKDDGFTYNIVERIVEDLEDILK